MKKSVLLAVLLVAVLLVCSHAAPPKKGRKHHGQPNPAGKIFDYLDKKKEGKVAVADAKAEIQKLLPLSGDKNIDPDSDGFVTKKEFRAFYDAHTRTSERPSAMFPILAFFCLLCGLGVLPAVQCAKKKPKPAPVESKQEQITQLVYANKAAPAAPPAAPAAKPAAKAEEKDGSKKNDSAKASDKEKAATEGVKAASEANKPATEATEGEAPVQSTPLAAGPSENKLPTGAMKPSVLVA
ncbi:hypothetical protein M3Y99_01096000 [Aphelenchoides fujianensis]|nr:hypothetical protein M3Y99_01096000 [Aphelenchoides fujianensis]